MRPGVWSPLWRHALEVGEHGLALRTVRLRAGDGATLPFLAVGAGFVAGEDYPCLGRVLLCQIKRGPGGDWAPRVVAARSERRCTSVWALTNLSNFGVTPRLLTIPPSLLAGTSRARSRRSTSSAGRCWSPPATGWSCAR